MSRSGAGVYSRPVGTTPADGDDIDAAPFNLLMDDIAADLNVPRPVVAGGTGASSAAGARTALGLAIGTDVQAYDAATVKGPAIAVDARLAVFDGTTGKLLKDGGVGVSGLATAAQGVLADAAAPKDSPALTGTPTAPTATAGTNTTQIATTAFVKAAVDAAGAGGAAAVATTSGTSHTVTGIPATVTRVVIYLDKVSLSGSAKMQLQLGDAGGIESDDYTGQALTFASSYATPNSSAFTLISSTNNTLQLTGRIVLEKVSGNTWSMESQIVSISGSFVSISTGLKTLSDTLTQIKLLNDGADTFDGGSMKVNWE